MTPHTPSTGSKTTQGRRVLGPIGHSEIVLRVVHCPEQAAIGRVIPLDGRRLTLGRDADELHGQLDDGRLSRRHCEISRVSGGHRLDDLSSSNGCFLNGAQEHREYLEPQMVIRVGDTLLVVDETPPLDWLPASDLANDHEASEIVGESFVAQAIRRSIQTAATSDRPVLLLGPSGTGKEVAARAIHRLSRRLGPLVPINCAGIPPELADAELFGHRKGAFTGAAEERPGLFVSAHRGTLFLDEIGEMPPGLQPKLLRILEDGVVRPVGSNTHRRVEVRVVAATNANVFAAKTFRPDLRARLSEWTLRLPPLRERRADILVLFRHLIAKHGRTTTTMTAEFAEALLLYDWPLNVRELGMLAGRLLKLAPKATEWDVKHLTRDMQEPIIDRDVAPSGDRPSRRALIEALTAARGNITLVAKFLGRDRRQIYRWLAHYKVNPDDFR